MKTDIIYKNAVIDGELKTIIISDGRFSEICENGTRGIDLLGKKVIPGLIDVHTHGIMGMDTMDGDLVALSKEYAKHGTTSFLPTTMTMPDEDLKRVCTASTVGAVANILGIHFEGPYIANSRKGAQNEKNIKKADINHFNNFKNVKMITLAPETEGAVDFIKSVSHDTVVSIGHTDCDCETALRAIKAGANCLTHTFNAMPPLLHRAPGPIGAAVSKNIYAQLICDGFHVAPEVVLAAYRMFGADRLTFISDSIRCAKCEDGVYNCGGLEVTLKDGAARLSDGTIAGSGVSLLDCVKCAVKFGIPEKDAVKMASETPANLLGVKKGKIAVGYDADMLVVDDDLNLLKVIIGGNIVGD